MVKVNIIESERGWGSKVDEVKEFDTIGYTGKDNGGRRTNYEAFLNSLGKGEFDITCTKRDSGDFSEMFTVVHVI